MAEPATQSPRTLTEDEAYAIVADRVSRETASLTTKVDDLTRENAGLQSKLDVSEAAVATEKAGRETAEKALADYKASVETDREIASRREGRVAKVREVAAHLKDDFFTDARTQRWAAMDDEAFAGYVAELAELSTGVSAAAGAPRETAMRGATPAATEATGNAGRLFDIRRGA